MSTFLAVKAAQVSPLTPFLGEVIMDWCLVRNRLDNVSPSDILSFAMELSKRGVSVESICVFLPLYFKKQRDEKDPLYLLKEISEAPNPAKRAMHFFGTAWKFAWILSSKMNEIVNHSNHITNDKENVVHKSSRA